MDNIPSFQEAARYAELVKMAKIITVLVLMSIILLVGCASQQANLLNLNESNITSDSEFETAKEPIVEKTPATSAKELEFISAGAIECGPVDEEVGGRHCSGTVTVDISRPLPIGTKMDACLGFQGEYGAHSGCVVYGSKTSTQSPPGRATFQLSDQNGFVICPPTITFVEVSALGDGLGALEGLSIPVKCI